MKTIRLLGLAALLAAIAYSNFAPTLSQAAPASEQPVTVPAPVALEPTYSLYLSLHKREPSPASAMRRTATCSE